MNQSSKRTGVSRRTVLKLAAAAGPVIVSARVLGQNAPSNRITLGFIGVGGHGHGYNLMNFLNQDDCQTVAVCDVFGGRADAAATTVNKHYKQDGCAKFGDFRKLLARRDIDAVCISTPDHWHVPISLMALEAGKDVMCEKPTLTIAEGRTLVETVARHKRVFQIGLEDRSVVYYHKMAELVRNGAIGTLRRIDVKLPAGPNPPKEEPVAPPNDLNWEMWLGPAPYHPFTPTRTKDMHWRQIKDYSGGMLADWGAHLLDTAQVGNFSELSGPVECEGEGKIPENSMATMPTTFKLKYRYANGVEMHVESGTPAIRFTGSDGWVGNNGWRGKLEAGNPDILKKTFAKESNKIWPMPPGEHRDFLNCVRSRAKTTYSAEDGHRLSTVMHVGNIAMWLGRKVTWDPKTESFPDDAAANQLRSREAREDWKRA